MGLGVNEAWALTLPELSVLMGVKAKQSRAAAGIPEPVTLEEVQAATESLKARGVIDENGVIARG